MPHENRRLQMRSHRQDLVRVTERCPCVLVQGSQTIDIYAARGQEVPCNKKNSTVLVVRDMKTRRKRMSNQRHRDFVVRL